LCQLLLLLLLLYLFALILSSLFVWRSAAFLLAALTVVFQSDTRFSRSIGGRRNLVQFIYLGTRFITVKLLLVFLLLFLLEYSGDMCCILLVVLLPLL
jgi:hypothetical protein